MIRYDLAPSTTSRKKAMAASAGSSAGRDERGRKREREKKRRNFLTSDVNAEIAVQSYRSLFVLMLLVSVIFFRPVFSLAVMAAH